MKHPIIDKILTEWAYRVHDGMPNPKNPLHIVHLKESLQHLKIDEEVIDIMINKLMEVKKKSKENKLKIQKGQNPTTVYHEVLCALAMKGSISDIKDGNDILNAINKGTVKPGVPGKKFKINKKHMSYLEDSIHDKMEVLKTDAKSIVKSIEKRIGKHTSGPVWWAGPSNDSTDYGASDMVIKTKKHGWVGVSLKAGKGQLKNLTINTFFKSLGIPFGDGQNDKAAKHFLTNYKTEWDAMTKDWVDLAEKEFNKKANNEEAKNIFKSHIKTDWDSFQSETMTQEEMDTLTDSVGMDKLGKSKAFKYFCHKMNNHFHGRKNYPGWNTVRDKHFDNIFNAFGAEYEGEIQTGLSDLFARQMSVGKKNMFYAASAGKTIWFIPSEEQFYKEFDYNSFIAQFNTSASGSGYAFTLDVGHQAIGAIGSITVTFRFKQGQMTKFPDTTSDYDLYADDWSKLLGTFEK